MLPKKVHHGESAPDETGGHDQSAGIDCPFRPILYLPYLCDHAVLDRDVGQTPRGASSIHYSSVLDQQIV
jgi:hypothetical protein